MFNPREKAVRAHSKNDQKGDVTREKLEAGINFGPDRLSDTKNNAARQSAPEVSQTSDDDRFKSEYEAAAADGRIEAAFAAYGLTYKPPVR